MSDTSKVLELPVNITVRELAKRLEASPIQVIKILMSNGVMANINQVVDFDTASIVASEFNLETTLESDISEELVDEGEIPFWKRIIQGEDKNKLQSRPPVVTILGHVDHGKTTLLDAIRHTDVAAGEAGGITQHIGAYQVEHHGKTITFLDTPGHAAFTAMRARGAQGADIVVLVVAADDGVMPQTKEAIAHAKAAKTPIIVALNKIDKQDANPDYTKRQLSEAGLVPDDWEGDTIVVPVSAKQKTGIQDLLEAILLVADNIEILANPQGKVLGTVIEAQVDRARGVEATLLVQNGTLETGSIILAGNSTGRIRAMFDYRGKKIRKAEPSTPVRVMGLNDVPRAGDIFRVYASEKEARVVVSENQLKLAQSATPELKVSLEDLFKNYQSGDVQELRMIIKADVQGSLEPLTKSIEELNSGDIKIKILHAETGNIGENDIMLASASSAIVVGFNVQADPASRKLAETEGVSIRLYNIIYRLLDDLEKAVKGMLEPEFREIKLGTAEVLAVFKITKVGNIAGCKVLNGELRRNGRARVMRNGEEIFSGEISSLKHEKDDVREVRTGFECGISFRNFNAFEVGDLIECFNVEKVN